jgi:mannose-6-phosphate isomerase-like protein (cupin superfamily)
LKSTHESAVAAQHHPDRWSKNLVGTEDIPTTNGFNLGVAEYHATDFSQVQVHDDQEALYVVSGEGEIKLDEEVLPLKPGTGVYVGPGVKHSTRRTGESAVKVVYTHGAV